MGRKKEMATRKPVSLTPELATAVDNYRFANRFKTESDAIRKLIELGLDAAKRQKERKR
jgi:Arc/MetJ-type ribon-helix-helix transcriptional regulator